MNYSIVCRLLSIIMGALALAFTASLIIALTYPKPGAEGSPIFGFSVSIVASLGVGGVLAWRSLKGEQKLFRKEALATIGIGWILASFLGALPYWLILPDCRFIDALFESTSGLTTTGATVFGNIEAMPNSLLFWRSLSQWIGGLGVVVFFVVVLSFLGAGAKILFSRESSAQSTDLQSARVQTGAYQLMALYLSLTAVCGVCFWAVGLNWFDAINHAFTTISTGGFSTRDTSIGGFENPAFEWVAILFMMLGGTSFVVLLRCVKGHWGDLLKSTEVKAYYLLLLLCTILTYLFTYSQHYTSWEPHLRQAAFQVVSIMTTTGFTTADYEQWPPVTHIILLSIMAIGGCSGSTSGGMKVFRFIIGLRVGLLSVEKSFRARVVRTITANGKKLQEGTLTDVTVFITLVASLSFFSFIILATLQPYISLEGIISIMWSTLFNIGPGLAEIGPTDNYGFLHDSTKLYLSFLMIAGRLELYAVLALFAPSLWKRY